MFFVISNPVTDKAFYRISDDEVLENADLFSGETPPDSNTDDIPVRRLDDFVIYDWDSLCLVPISVLLHLDSDCSDSGRRYGASGLVQPWIDDSDSDSDDDGEGATAQRIGLSPILELNVHNFSDGILDP